MNFFQTVQERRSVRSFAPAPVEATKVQAIFQAANQAPSAGNLQAYEIFHVQDSGAKEALAAAALGQKFISRAPTVLVFCAHPHRSSGRYGQRGASLYCLQDATIACAYAQLAATSLGLGSVWVGAFSEEAVRRALDSGEHLLPVAILPIGYAEKRPGATPRRLLTDLVHPV